MENKEFFQKVLNHFQVEMDEKKLSDVTFNAELPDDGEGNKVTYVLYPFYANRPYVLIVLQNMSVSKSLEMIYYEEKEHDVFSSIIDGDEQLEVPYYPYDYLDISNSIANRLVQLFPYTHLNTLENLLSKIMENLSNVIENYHEDPRIRFIEEHFNAEVKLFGYELDPDINLLSSLMTAKVKYDNVMNLLMVYNLGISNKLTPYSSYKNLVNSSYLSIVGEFTVDTLSEMDHLIKDINKGLKYNEQIGFLCEDEWYFDDKVNLYLVALVNSVKGIKTK